MIKGIKIWNIKNLLIVALDIYNPPHIKVVMLQVETRLLITVPPQKES